MTEILAAIDRQIATLSSVQRTAVAVGEIASSDVRERVRLVRDISIQVAAVSEPLIKERLAVLNAATTFVGAVVTAT